MGHPTCFFCFLGGAATARSHANHITHIDAAQAAIKSAKLVRRTVVARLVVARRVAALREAHEVPDEAPPRCPLIRKSITTTIGFALDHRTERRQQPAQLLAGRVRMVARRPAIRQDADRELHRHGGVAQVGERHLGLRRHLLPRWHDALELGHRLALREVDQPRRVDEVNVREQRLELGASILVPLAPIGKRRIGVRPGARRVGGRTLVWVHVVDGLRSLRPSCRLLCRSHGHGGASHAP